MSGLQARLRRDIANAQWLAERVAATPHWRVVAPVPLQTVCVLHEPRGRRRRGARPPHAGLGRRVNRSGRAYLTPAVLGGRWMVRVSIGAEATERHHLAQLLRVISEAVTDSLRS